MQEEATRIQQEVQFEAALGVLREPSIASQAIVDSLDALRTMRSLSPSQARQVLGLAADNISTWIVAVGSDSVIDAVFPAIDSAREHVRASDNAELESEFTAQTSRVIAHLIMAEPDRYDEELDSQLKQGRFGNRGPVLTGVLTNILHEGEESRVFGTRNSGYLARIIDDVITLEDPSVLEPLRPALPFQWLDKGYGEQELKHLFPRVYQLLTEPLLHSDETYRDLARIFVTLEDRKPLKERVKSGQLGDVFDIFGKVLGVLTSDEVQANPSVLHENVERTSVEKASEDLWIELLEINRGDPRLRPLRERLIGKDWYWDPDSAIYTLMETIDNMGVTIGHEADFIKTHATEISQHIQERVMLNQITRRKYGQGIALAIKRGELTPRLGAILSEIQQIRGRLSYDDLQKSYPNDLLFAALHSPITTQLDLQARVNAWFDSLPEVSPDEAPLIEKMIFDALDRSREQQRQVNGEPQYTTS